MSLSQNDDEEDLNTEIIDLSDEIEDLDKIISKKINEKKNLNKENDKIHNDFKKFEIELDEIIKENQRFLKEIEEYSGKNNQLQMKQAQDDNKKLQNEVDELKNEKIDLEERLKTRLELNKLSIEFENLINELTLIEQKEIFEFPEDQREERIILKIISKIPEKGLRDAVNKFSKKEQKDTVLLPKEEREKELEKIKKELSEKNLCIIKSYDKLCSLSKHALRDTVTSIDLSMNNITKENVIEMSNSILPYCHKLSSLCLSCNPGIGDEGVIALVNALSLNQHFSECLTLLGLSGVNVTDKGAKAIAIALPKLKNLQDLYLYKTFKENGVKNNITDVLQKEIMEAALPNLKNIKF